MNPRRDRARQAILFATLTAAALAVAPSPASASTGDIIAPQHPPDYTPDDGWQAGTCTEEPPESAEVCSVATHDQFFERAAAHPNWGFTQFIVKHTTEQVGSQTLEKPEGELAKVRVDLPVGLSVNPGATERCDLATFESGAGSCPPESNVGTSYVTPADPLVGIPLPTLEADVYNIKPPPGEPALFGLELAGNEIFLRSDVAWAGDYHEGFTIDVPKALPAALEGVILKNRLVFDGRSGDGTFITTPSTCLGEATPGPSGSAYSTYLLAGSYEEFEEPGYVFPASAEPAFESPIPPETSPKECETIPYEPSVEVDPNTDATNSPSGAGLLVEVPHILGGGEQDSSNTRTARVTLPPGFGINPSAANGLRTCDDDELGKGTEKAVACPPESKIGTVTIESPPLPEGDLEGDVFVGRQLSRDPTSGEEYRIFVDAESARYGVSVRLIGRVSADPRTGRLTTTFADNPQVPFTAFRLDLDPGAGAALSSPPTCGPNTTATELTPWSGNPAATPSDSFELTSLPGGGKCPTAMAARPFAPGFAAVPASAKAGAYSPFSLHISRVDGEQELKGADLRLPPGMVAKLAGIPYCGEGALAAAASAAGAAERSTPSCPDASLVGRAAVAAGTGPLPLHIDGKVFLSGPYHGAPLSLAVVTPATAGPFDLGTVVVRVALFVDPETAQVRALSDPIPDVFGGTQLSIRSIDVAIDRPGFTLNPTSCEPLATAGTLSGGGADPTDPAAFSAFAVSAPFQAGECDALGFRPKLRMRLLGGPRSTRRSGFPKLRAVLTAREGDANIRRAVVTLPHSEFLAQAHIRTVCTRPELEARACPPQSVYGHAQAQTPLLDDELAGPVYLVPGGHELPDLVIDLRGQVNVRLRGVVSSAKARIKTVFSSLPDVPVSKFTLTMQGGKKGLLENSRDLCPRPSFSSLNFEAQNGKRLRSKQVPLIRACNRG